MSTLLIRVDELPSGGGGYSVTASVVDDPAAGRIQPVASGVIVGPLPEPRIPGLDPRSFILSGAAPDGTVGAIGTWLHSLIGPGEVGPRLRAYLEARRADTEHRHQWRVLLDVRPADLRRLPWELLQCDLQHPFIDPNHPCARGSLEPPVEPQDIRVPLRVMTVIADPESADLEWEAELSAIQIGLRTLHGRLHPEVLYGPSREELFTELRLIRPHVLHVVGHGEFREQDGTSRIEFLDRSTSTRWWLTSVEIANGIVTPAPRVVVLNACRTGDLAAQDGTWNLIEALRSMGVLGVVAMQADMPSEAAVTFAAKFYEEIGAGHPIDVAANRGRHAVWLRFSHEQREWAMPSLTVWAPPDRILPLRCGAAQEAIEAIRRCKAHRHVERFVDRYRERRMWLSVDPDDQPDHPARVLLVTGEVDAGKTDLVYSCLLTCFLRGRRLTYVDLDRKPMDWLDVLRRIRQGVPDLPLAPALDTLDRGAFTTWSHDINYLARGEWPAPARFGKAEDERGRFAPRSEDADQQIEFAFELFGSALVSLADDQPFIVALDHLEGIAFNDFRRYLWPNLVQRVADGDLGHVRMIVVLRPEQRAAFVPDDADLSHVEEVEVATFAPKDYPRLAREYLARHGHRPMPEYDELFTARAKTLARDAATWTPREFELLKQLLRRVV